MTVLVTGAAGYVGGLIVKALREHGGYGDVLAFGRAEADLTVPGVLDAVPTAGITHIVHAAAVTKFAVDRDTAKAVNIGGTEQVVGLAERCPDLERIVLLSTLYTAGLATGDIAEEPAGVIEEPRAAGGEDDDSTDVVHFANYYEWSKHAAERLVLDSGLPATIARVPTIIADDDSGHVSQYNAVHNTLKLLYYGLLSLMPGLADVPVALGTGEFTVNATMALLDAEPGYYHVCPDLEQTPRLGRIVDLMFSAFEQDTNFIRRQILRPLLVDEAAFANLINGLRTLPHGPVLDALESVSPFSSQLFRPKVFGNTRLHKAWPNYRAPDSDALVSQTAEYLVRTRWGRTS
ncbi:SDR family oxidoreductase [Streptomyces sp. NBC_00448]|uniref:SDR family oxidoreductase n=1 Tax=Streptomyces sp. NBC_00448 TaxID=2903652 RepID=UPI002E1A40A4